MEHLDEQLEGGGVGVGVEGVGGEDGGVEEDVGGGDGVEDEAGVGEMVVGGEAEELKREELIAAMAGGEEVGLDLSDVG